MLPNRAALSAAFCLPNSRRSASVSSTKLIIGQIVIGGLTANSLAFGTIAEISTG
jgi:hypothetical protein